MTSTRSVFNRGRTASVSDGILRGMYQLRTGVGAGKRVQLLGAGTILREVLAAAELLEQEYAVAADVWSVTSFSELRRDGLECDRWNMLHPAQPPRQPYLQRCLAGRQGPVIAASDYMHIVADQVRPWVPARYLTLGTDGYGRSDSRAKLREFFEVDRNYVVLSALKALADDGALARGALAAAIEQLGIDPEKPNPVNC